jgi:hypothetical protein
VTFGAFVRRGSGTVGEQQPVMPVERYRIATSGLWG